MSLFTVDTADTIHINVNGWIQMKVFHALPALLLVQS